MSTTTFVDKAILGAIEPYGNLESRQDCHLDFLCLILSVLDLHILALSR
jgi:hypothetical protein